MTFNPAGTVTLRPASADLFASPQEAGVTSVTPDSTLALASLTTSGPTTASFLVDSTVTGITAKAGGTQNGTVLTAANNYISVCATAADSVVLPAEAPVGAQVFIRNDGAQAARVYAVTPGTINGVATGTGVTLAAAASAVYRQRVLGTWVT